MVVSYYLSEKSATLNPFLSPNDAMHGYKNDAMHGYKKKKKN